jgi:predicted DNA-binding ribbon-helix-helix protein
MKIKELRMLQTLYEQDFFAWVEQTREILRLQQWDKLDLENLIEEIADLGKSQQRALQSALRLILLHLLKWKYQSERRSRSWEITITRERLNIDELLQESPSLRSFLNNLDWINTTYQRARREAMVETGLSDENFPSACPFDTDEILDLDFYPQSEDIGE